MAVPHHDPDVLDSCSEFLSNYKKQDLLRLAEKYPDERSLHLDCMYFFKGAPELADDFLEQPDYIGGHLEQAIKEFSVPVDTELADVTIRAMNTGRELHVDELRADHMNKYLTVKGQVGRTTQVKHFPKRATFNCLRCGVPTTVRQDGKTLQEPIQCEGCERQGPWELDAKDSEWVDQQIIRLREPPERAKGASGAKLDVYLKDDVVDVVDPGDRVSISGIYRIAENEDLADSAGVGTHLEGKAIEVEKTDFEDIDVSTHIDRIESVAAADDPMSVLVESFAPEIRGYEAMKESIILQMFGGTHSEVEAGMDYRGDIHILLIGDPGSAKSSLLHTVEKIAPRAVFASGKGLTKAGATAAAVRDDFGEEEWSLKAGALVLANKGVACIDEIDKVNTGARSSLHGALESQRVDVSKAGINASLPAKTSVLAAGNPAEGRFDAYEPIPSQIDLGPALLSRFDLIFTVTDKPDADDDALIAEHMVRGRQRGAYDPPVDETVFQAYIAHAKRTVNPEIEDESVKDELVEFYVGKRSSYDGDVDSPIPVTPRALHATMRLAEASARVRLSDAITLRDVERAERLVEAAMGDSARDPETGEFDADIIETGQSKTQRDRRRGVRAIVDDLDGGGDGAPKGSVIEAVMDEYDVGRGKAENDVEQLLHQGELFQPSNGTLRVT